MDREALAKIIEDRRLVRRFIGRRSIDKTRGEVVHDSAPDGPISDETIKVVETVDLPNFAGEAAARERAEELGDLWTVDAILAEIKAQGYVIVPREPTDEMKIAGADKLFGSSQDDWGDEAADIYRVMLSALEDQ